MFPTIEPDQKQYTIYRYKIAGVSCLRKKKITKPLITIRKKSG